MTEIDMPKNRVGTSGTLGTDLTDTPVLMHIQV